ncbi:MAG: glycosyltransferase family 2 protein [Burkholderiales bacterium]
MSVVVSVVVPTCGRPDLLRRCVAALEAQSLPSASYEIIVVDDTRTRRGPAATRNIGWRRAKAPIVAFTDDDTVPDRDWLARALAAVEPGVDAVTGRLIMPLPDRPTDYERNEQGLERAEFVTANCFVRRQVLERLGGFDESFRLPWREDSDLHFRLLEAGCRIVRAPDAVVVHPVRPAPWGVSLRQQRKVMFDALLFRKHRALYRSRIRRAPRWDYYVVVGALLASPFSGAALFLWALLTARFCWYRLRGTSKAPAHVAEMIVTSILIPPLSLFWRLVGALKFRVAFV